MVTLAAIFGISLPLGIIPPRPGKSPTARSRDTEAPRAEPLTAWSSATGTRSTTVLLTGRDSATSPSSSDSAWAAQAVAGHPVGSQTKVFYNPRNPQEAVLSPGVDGSDLVLMLFLMPFNMVTLGFCTWVGGWLRERLFKPVAGGVRIITDGPRTRIRLPEYTAMVWCMMAVGVVSFVFIFILAFASRFHPSLPLASLVLFVVGAAGAGANWWQWRIIHSGDDDLILDEGVGRRSCRRLTGHEWGDLGLFGHRKPYFGGH